MGNILNALPGSFKAVPWRGDMWKVRYTGRHNFKNYMVALTRSEAEAVARRMNDKYQV